MKQIEFVIGLIIIFIVVGYIFFKERFTSGLENFMCPHKQDECSIYGQNYSACYNSGCTIMNDVQGNPFCTSKNISD